MATSSGFTAFAVVSALSVETKKNMQCFKLHSCLVPSFKASVKHLNVVGVEHLHANMGMENAAYRHSLPTCGAHPAFADLERSSLV